MPHIYDSDFGRERASLAALPCRMPCEEAVFEADERLAKSVEYRDAFHAAILRTQPEAGARIFGRDVEERAMPARWPPPPYSAAA